MTTTKQSWLKRSLAVLLAVMMVMSMGVANVFAAGTDEVSIPDANLKAAINRQLAKQTGSQRADDAAVTEDDMASLTELVAENAGITDLTGLEKAVNLETLDLSGNDLQGIVAQAANHGFFNPMIKLKVLDLSNCNANEEFQPNAFDDLLSLEVVDISDNNLYGMAGLGYETDYNKAVDSYKKLKSIDFSNNNLIGFEFSPVVSFDSLEKIDLTGNRIWPDEASTAGDSNWYQTLLTSNIWNTVDFSDQKSLMELHGLWLEGDSDFNQRLEQIDSEQKNIDLGSTLGSSVEFALSYYGEYGALNVQVQGTDNIKMVENYQEAPKNHSEKITIKLEGLSQGQNTFQLLFTHANGDTMTWTATVNSQPMPVAGQDSAGIVDEVLYKTILNKLGKEPGYDITKSDMASLSGTLQMKDLGIKNAQGLQYATGLTKINIIDTELSEIPDLSPLKDGNLKSLILRGSYNEVPGIEKLTKLTNINLSSAETWSDFGPRTIAQKFKPGHFPTPDLSALTNLTVVNINSDAMETSVKISSTNLSTLGVAMAQDGSLPDISGKTITDLDVNNYTGDDLSSYLNSATEIGTLSIIGFRGDLDLSELQFGKSTASYSTLNLGADCSDGDVSINIDSLMATNKNQDIRLTLSTVGNGTLSLRGTNTCVDQLTIGKGSYSLEEGFATPTVSQITFETGFAMKSQLPDSFSRFDALNKLTIKGDGMYNNTIPSNFNSCPSLTSITISGTEETQFAEDVDWKENSKLTSLTISGYGSLIPKGECLPSSLEKLEITGNNNMGYLDALNGANLPNLTRLTVAGLYEFPTEFIQNLPALTYLNLSSNRFSDIPANAFDNNENLSSVSLGAWLKVDMIDSAIVPVPGTGAAMAIDKLKARNPEVTVSLNGYSSSNPGYYCSLLSVSSNMGSVMGDPFIEELLTLYVPSGTQEITITTKALYDDTTISINGKIYQSGETITLPIQSFSETFEIVTHNDFINYANLPTEKNYTLSVIQGEVMEEFIPQDGGVYNMNYRLMLAGNDTKYSMADNYVTHLAEVRYHADAEPGKQYDIRFTVTNTDWITDMRYYDHDGIRHDADIISEDLATKTRTYRIYTDDISKIVKISPYVVPMSKYPTCDLKLDLTSAVDISGSVSVDTANLNAAINAAIEITEKRNVYTDESYQNFLTVLEEAQAIAELSAPAQSAVDEAAEALVKAMTVGSEGGLVIDESKLANKTALETAINEAKALQQGNHTATAWNALQEAIADAQAVCNTLEASQTEVDTAAKSLNTAVTLFQNSGEASELDKNNLEDGVYSVYGEMIKTNREEKSMSNNAINHYIKLTVEDGKYYLNMDFHGLAYLNKFGYLAELSYYDDGYTYGQYGTVEGTLIPATVLSTQKNADGSDLYDEFNQTGGSYEGKLYPDQIQFPLVAGALADADGYVPLHVFVPVMEDISAGTGDQDVLLKLDWSTLTKTTEDDPNFKPEEPVEQSPAVDFTDSATGVKVKADKGVFDEGVQIVVSEITQGANYDAAVSSLSDVGKKFKLYDVKFLDADGNEVTPNGTVSISFPVAAGYDSTNLAVYRLADGGKVLVRGAVENGYYTVITKTAGTYALVEKGSTITDAENTENAENQNQGNTNIPQTGDNSNIAAYALLALAAAGMMGVTLVTRKRKSEEA